MGESTLPTIKQDKLWWITNQVNFFFKAEGNSQSIQQQTPQNAIYLDARRVQPGPLSRILDRPSSFQMSERPGNMESSFEFQQRSQPQPSGRVEQAPFRIQL